MNIVHTNIPPSGDADYPAISQMRRGFLQIERSGGDLVLMFLKNVAQNVPTIIGTLLVSCVLVKWKQTVLEVKSLMHIGALSVVTTVIELICCLALGATENTLFRNNIFVSFQGVFLLGPIVFFGAAKCFRINVAAYFDVVAMIAAVTLLIARIGCISSGCCEGVQLFETHWRWPVREAELTFCFIVTMILILKSKRCLGKGLYFPWLMMTHGVYRFFAEGFVDAKSIAFGFHPVHIWSIVSFIAGSTIYADLRKQLADMTIAESHRR